MLFQGSEVPEISVFELAMLERAMSDIEWAEACNLIKESRGGMYPPDWLDKVERSGLMARVFKRFCAACS